jgi:hypothetical protein
MRWDQTTVFLRLGTTRGPLTLRRVPRFLRFVVRGTDWATLDALDQLDDEPAAGETVIAAEKADESSVHLDYTERKTGRRRGLWERTATYAPVADPPADDVLRDTAKWQAWCLARIAEAGGAQT